MPRGMTMARDMTWRERGMAMTPAVAVAAGEGEGGEGGRAEADHREAAPGAFNRRPTSLRCVECPVSESVRSDTRPRPATGEAARGEGPDGADADDARRERRGAWPPAASSHARTIPCGRQPTNRPTGPAGLTDRGHARLASAPPRGSADARLPPCPRLLSLGADSGQQGAR
jgi:hypothetical protein